MPRTAARTRRSFFRIMILKAYRSARDFIDPPERPVVLACALALVSLVFIL